ncbi:bifunctional 5-dehydro-2-deoxygluconokinase/5-dehydro-2-deoxyphosphogluconate aldolase [Granulibacter bethesdensis]|uniref:bifunctional 5-dehydro-2-deoxygluconokinase/5-dehydro-2- deoxyphosphogluconate aldolase n=1 Tax=Granulibacter bethesdensis TaxID=364410 RepID=UPI0003F1F846|nr:5-dehydro-2-deoxygluconokinase [Granulibacter bethesdensis]AHJ66515.1 5-dehydro-2-deoxygluconokinase [Granulibacter bethesdensis CGDNIH4]
MVNSSAGSDETKLDVITIGRAGVDLYGDQIGGRLEDMGSFAKYVGGSPTNTAIGVARLGLNAALLTRVGNDHMGRFIIEELDREGVDTRGVRIDPERLTALAILGIRDQETFPLIFYRENCADMGLVTDDIDVDFVQSARAVLVNGTHLSRPNVFATCWKAIEIIKAAGGRVIFDIDYRPVLWGLTSKDMGENRFVAAAEVTRELQKILPMCDLIVGTEEEIHILGGSTDTMTSLRAIRARSDALLVCKRGPEGCVAFAEQIPDSLDGGIVGRGFPIEVLNVLGAGDAFMAGFLRGWLQDRPVATCCEYGNACGALVVSRHGCAPAMPSWEELQIFLQGQDWPYRLRDSAYLEHVHWATNRTRDYSELIALAMDHRSQFEDLVAELGTGVDRVPAFKSLALHAVERVADGDLCFGLLLDGRFGARALEQAADLPYWIGRPIEKPGSRPLVFEGSPDVGVTLREWPLHHVVKCLVFYHPDDPKQLRTQQDQQLLRLFDACRATRHELLLEIIASRHGTIDHTTVSRVIEHVYDLGIYPDWWKLEPTEDPVAWENISAAINRRDPFCRGVVLLGLSAPEEELIASFCAAAAFDIVKGFAVGRTIFHGVAAQWLAGDYDDEQAIAALTANFRTLVDAWRIARSGCKTEVV